MSDMTDLFIVMLKINSFHNSPSSLPHLLAYGSDTIGYRTSEARPKAATKGPLMSLYQQFAPEPDRQTSSRADRLTYWDVSWSPIT